MSFRTCVVLTTLSAAACASGVLRPAAQSNSPGTAACAPFERADDPVWYYIPEDGSGLTKGAAKDDAFRRAKLKLANFVSSTVRENSEFVKRHGGLAATDSVIQVFTAEAITSGLQEVQAPAPCDELSGWRQYALYRISIDLIVARLKAKDPLAEGIDLGRELRNAARRP